MIFIIIDSILRSGFRAVQSLRGRGQEEMLKDEGMMGQEGCWRLIQQFCQPFPARPPIPPLGLWDKVVVGHVWKQNSRKSYSFKQRLLAGLWLEFLSVAELELKLLEG